jgi:hypothetical protein
MSFINFSNIKAYIESKINVINTLTTIEASQVAVNAFQLARIGYAPSNLSALETYLSDKEAAVSTTDELKYITQLLGSSTPTKSVVWRMREFLADGTFTVPNNLAGDCVYITGSGGGGAGAAQVTGAAIITISGANSGCFIERQPYSCSLGESILVEIGAGGVPVNSSVRTTAPINGGNGGDTRFGTILISGGEGAGIGNVPPQAGGRYGGYSSNTNQFRAESSLRFPAGASTTGSITSVLLVQGSAAGFFGRGESAAAAINANATAESADPNSGAGGGSCGVSVTAGGPFTATSGAGGSGRIIVEWQEFL